MPLLDHPWIRFLYGGPKPESDPPFDRAARLRAEYRRINRERRSDSIRRRPRPADPLAGLPNLNADLSYHVPLTAQKLSDLLRESWTAEWARVAFKNGPGLLAERDPYGPGSVAWLQAAQWVADHHAPPRPPEPLELSFAWDWPSPEVSQSPKPLGVGDLEDGPDYEDDDA